MKNTAILRAIESGQINTSLRARLAELVKSADIFENRNGKIYMLCRPLMESQKGVAYVIANWDQYESTSALITHDLASFEARDLGSLVSKLRTEV